MIVSDSSTTRIGDYSSPFLEKLLRFLNIYKSPLDLPSYQGSRKLLVEPLEAHRRFNVAHYAIRTVLANLCFHGLTKWPGEGMVGTEIDTDEALRT